VFIVGSSTGSLMCFMRIAVHDTGPGLRPAERERLFKRFGQGMFHYQTNLKGTEP
jgi:K+-sensing histidine kinase KdpD